MKYLIFDFDGVLGDTYEANLQARINLGRVKTREEAIERVHAYFDNPHTHSRNHTMPEAELADFKRRVCEMGKELHRLGFPLFDAFFDELHRITDKKVAIVSTGAHYIKEKTLPKGFEPTHILTFEEHHSKEEKIEQICKDWGVPTSEVHYITDSRADIFELENFLDRKKIIGVSWGFCGYEKLRDLLPENQVLKEFNDIHRALKS